MEYPTNQFIPIKKEYHNITYKRPPSMQECNDLELYRGKKELILNFKIDSEEERKKFLEHGEITISLAGHSLPPISVFCGDAVEFKKPKQETKRTQQQLENLRYFKNKKTNNHETK